MSQKIKSRLADIALVLFLLSAFTVSLSYFFIDLNKVTIYNDKPVATIVSRQKIVQRKSSASVVWDRLQKNSFLYSDDIIRTAKGSEAKISFPEKAEIEMLENSMIQLTESKNGVLRLHSTGGKVKLNTASSRKDVKIEISKGTVLNLKSGTKIISSTENGVNTIIISDGTAQIEQKDGNKKSVQSFETGDVIMLNGNGDAEKSSLIDLSDELTEIVEQEIEEIKLKEIIEKERLEKTKNNSAEENLPNLPEEKSDEVKNQEEEKSTETEIKNKTEIKNQKKEKLNSAENKKKESAVKTGKKLKPLPSVILLEPKQNFVVNSNYLRQNRKISFAWNEVIGATDYSLELIQKLKNGSRKKIITKSLKKNSYVMTDLTVLDVGVFEWSVTAFIHDKFGNEIQRSEKSVNSFVIDFDLPDVVKTEGVEKIYVE